MINKNKPRRVYIYIYENELSFIGAINIHCTEPSASCHPVLLSTSPSQPIRVSYHIGSTCHIADAIISDQPWTEKCDSPNRKKKRRHKKHDMIFNKRRSLFLVGPKICSVNGVTFPRVSSVFGQSPPITP